MPRKRCSNFVRIDRPPPARSARRMNSAAIRRQLRWLLLAVPLTGAWLGWLRYDYRSAVHTAAEAGWLWEPETSRTFGPTSSPRGLIDLIRTKRYRDLHLGGNGDIPQQFAQYRPVLVRLHQTSLVANRSPGKDLSVFQGFNELQCLYLKGCPTLQTLDGLQSLTGLQNLRLTYCRELQNVDALKGLTGLRYLGLKYCPALQNVDAIQGLTRLESLDLKGCSSLQTVDSLNGLVALRFLSLINCSGLQNVDALKRLTSLRLIDLRGCSGLRNVDGLKGLTGLQRLNLRDCSAIPASKLRELREALPKTVIVFPNGMESTPP